MAGKLSGMAKNFCIPALRRHALAGLASVLAVASGLTHTPAFAQQASMKLHLYLDGATATATLDDSAAARDFAALLPLSLTLENYAVIERIANLPRKLRVTGAPVGTSPKTGDIAYYAPWGNLAIFVGDDAYAPGLVRLGRVDTGLPALQRPGPLQVRIERVQD